MHTARNKLTFDLTEAEDLWSMDFVDSNAYICRACPTPVFPASYDKAHNKKRPYFTLGPINKHQTGCDVDGEERFIKQAKQKSIGTTEGFPLPFASSLTLTDERIITPDEQDQTAQGAGGRIKSRSDSQTFSSKRHGHTVKTIRPICRTFINFPYDRKNLPLTIPGAPGSIYSQVFSYLRNVKPETLSPKKRLYYAPIRWVVDPVQDDAYCELTLNTGEWIAAERKHASFNRVRVDWRTWSQSRKNSLVREFKTTQEEAASQYRKEVKSDKQVKGWLFFMGTQDAIDPSLFHVENYRLICCLAAEMIWP